MLRRALVLFFLLAGGALRAEEPARLELTAAIGMALEHNRELAQQCKDIERELMQVEMGFCDDYGLQPARSRLKPQQLDKLLAQLKRGLEAELAAMRHDLRMLEQPQAFKRWLKEQRQQERFEQAFDAAGPFR